MAQSRLAARKDAAARGDAVLRVALPACTLAFTGIAWHVAVHAFVTPAYVLPGPGHVLRTLVIHIRPGHNAEFEAQIKEINAHADKMPNTHPVLISQVVDGENSGAYYITFLRKSLGDFDKEVMLPDILGQEGMAKLEKTVAEVEQHSESAIYRFRPDLSYPPDQVAEAAPDFWNPKPMMAATKTKTSAASAKTKK